MAVEQCLNTDQLQSWKKVVQGPNFNSKKGMWSNLSSAELGCWKWAQPEVKCLVRGLEKKQVILPCAPLAIYNGRPTFSFSLLLGQICLWKYDMTWECATIMHSRSLEGQEKKKKNTTPERDTSRTKLNLSLRRQGNTVNCSSKRVLGLT